MTIPMNVGRIIYTNTEPFFAKWPYHLFPVMSGFPRQLAQAARDGEIVAGALPIVECWNLEREFDPLGSFGIAAKGACQSVLLLSKRPMSDLRRVTVGLTRESSTSVMLLDVLMKYRYQQIDITYKRGLQPNDDAWLMIGDQALRVWDKGGLPQWPYVTDLAVEWWKWQQLPFVFALWVCLRRIEFQMKERLHQTLASSLEAGLASLPEIAARQWPTLLIPSEKIVRYLQGFTYMLGEEEMESARIFRQLAHGRVSELASSPV